MKPLASPGIEFRTLGLSEVVAGVAFAATTTANGRPGQALVGIVLGALIFGGGMYLTYRRFIGKAVRNARPARMSAIEASNRTRVRAVATTAVVVVLLVLLSLAFKNGSIPAGIIFGNGLALVGVSSWLSRWERYNHAQLLREPKWRWSAAGGRGWGRGRGVMDPQDFYVRAGDTPRAADSPDGSRAPVLR